MTDRLLYPISEAARLLGIGRTLLYEELAAERIETVTVGRRRLIPRQALDAYVEHLRAANEAEAT
jgi:excisionase family DNA binding protein